MADSRMRIWYSSSAEESGGSGGSGNADGLLFAARLGDVDLDRPVGVLHRRKNNNLSSSSASAQDDDAQLEATLAAQQTPAQREAVRALRPRAAAAWW